MATERIGQVYDPTGDVEFSEGHLPHWAQANAITFVTMRLADSIPAEVVRRWERERTEWINRQGIACDGDWKTERELFDHEARRSFDKHFDRAREDTLDTCLGKCELRDARAAREVSDSLLKFDGDRYVMGDFVIMPNHVHFLAVFRQAEMLRKQCGLWMRFTARTINEILGRSGTLWYEEPFDHLVRSEMQLNYLRRYIADNPASARIPDGQFLYRRSIHHF